MKSKLVSECSEGLNKKMHEHVFEIYLHLKGVKKILVWVKHSNYMYPPIIKKGNIQIDWPGEGLVTTMCTDHQGADEQCRSCPMVVRALPQREHCSVRNLKSAAAVAAAAVVSGASPASEAALRTASRWTVRSKISWTAWGMSYCQLRPAPTGRGPGPAGGHPPRDPGL